MTLKLMIMLTLSLILIGGALFAGMRYQPWSVSKGMGKRFLYVAAVELLAANGVLLLAGCIIVLSK
jgi:hypothetical protein